MSKGRGKRGRNVSKEQTVPGQSKSPPSKLAKMAECEPSLDSFSPELRALAQLFLSHSKQQHEAVLSEFKTVGSKLETLDAKVADISAEITTLRGRVNDLENGASFQSDELTQLRHALQQERRERVRADLLAERYSMKSDVIVRGLMWNKDEDSAHVFRDFVSKQLNIQEQISLVAVHRLAKPTQTRPNPPMLARLVNFQQRDLILRAGRRRRREKDYDYVVHEHLPRPLQEARGKLVPDRDAEISRARDSRRDFRISIWTPPKDTCAILLVDGKTVKKVDAVDLVCATKDSMEVKQV